MKQFCLKTTRYLIRRNSAVRVGAMWEKKHHLYYNWVRHMSMRHSHSRLKKITWKPVKHHCKTRCVERCWKMYILWLLGIHNSSHSTLIQTQTKFKTQPVPQTQTRLYSKRQNQTETRTRTQNPNPIKYQAETRTQTQPQSPSQTRPNSELTAELKHELKSSLKSKAKPKSEPHRNPN